MKNTLKTTRKIFDQNHGILSIVPDNGVSNMNGRIIVRDYLLNLYSYKRFETINDLTQSEKQHITGIMMHYADDFDIEPTEAWGESNETSNVAHFLSDSLKNNDRYSDDIFLTKIKNMFCDYYKKAMNLAIEDALQEISSIDHEWMDAHHHNDNGEIYWTPSYQVRMEE